MTKYKVVFKYSDLYNFGSDSDYKKFKRDLELDLVEIGDFEYTEIEIEAIKYNNKVIINGTFYTVDRLFLNIGEEKSFLCFVRSPKDESNLPF
jgi:hypothetical protein